MSRNYDELIQSANKAMLEKLKENEHKSGFDDIEFCYAVGRIEDEQRKLISALKNFSDAEYDYNVRVDDYQEHGSENEKAKLIAALKEMRREAADVANFPAMIILKCDKMIAELEEI